MPATLREMRLGRAAVEAPEVGKAQLVGVGGGTSLAMAAILRRPSNYDGFAPA